MARPVQKEKSSETLNMGSQWQAYLGLNLNNTNRGALLKFSSRGQLITKAAINMAKLL